MGNGSAVNTKAILKKSEPVILILLAAVFTAGLMFASVEAPRAVDRLLDRELPFLDVATGQDELTDYKTELFLSQYRIRLIGYICLGFTLVLIVAGVVLEKHRLASAGAVILFLPVFGHFAATMFFLGGLAFLRFLWLPFLDISFDVMRLGEVILLPYQWILGTASLIRMNLYRELPFIITGLGIFIFLVGVLAWMHGKILKKTVTDFRIYRISRHPQYLGWIVWSYGVLFLPGPNMNQYVEVANTLPWLLATMIIVGVALLEERTMSREHGDAYDSYRQRTPFLFPLPRIVKKLFSLPVTLVFKKEYPDRKREIAYVVAFYTAVGILLSALLTGMTGLPARETPSVRRIDGLVHTIRTTGNRAEIRNAAASLVEIGGAAVDSLIGLLEHESVFVRRYSADALGDVHAEKVVQPLAALLDDTDADVRRAAAGALGFTGSPQAAGILMDAFLDEKKDVGSDAARSLGRLGAGDAVPLLVEGLKSDDTVVVRWCAWALGEIGAVESVPPLIECFEQREDCDYLMVGEALEKLGSKSATDAYIAGMKNGAWWIQSGCATALGELESEKGFDALVGIMRTGEVRVRRAAVLAISQYPPGQAEAPLKEALGDEDWEVRLYANAALRSIRNPDK